MTDVDVGALRSGDELAYRVIVNEYGPVLLRAALAYLPCRSMAEEAVQETWIAVLRGLHGFEGKSSLRTWINRILVNEARRRAVVESRSLPFSALDDGDSPAAPWPDLLTRTGSWLGRWARDDWSRLPEDRLLSRELRYMIVAAVARLPRSQREVIILRDMHDWTAADVFRVLGIPDNNQRVLLHRARGRVRRSLQDYVTPAPAETQFDSPGDLRRLPDT